MIDQVVSVAEIKARLSEYLTVSHNQEKRIIITKRGKPFAAIISMADLKNLEQHDEKEGLANIAGKWEHFEEVAPAIEEAYMSRSRDKFRNVSI